MTIEENILWSKLLSFNLDDVNSYSDSNYTNELSENDFVHFTNDVCSYYGAINFDGCPTTYNENELLQLINDIKNENTI
jgi:pantothenate kinase